MSCLSFDATRIGGTKITATRVRDFSATFALVCGTNLAGEYQLLFASDGQLYTSDGGYIMVKRRA